MAVNKTEDVERLMPVNAGPFVKFTVNAKTGDRLGRAEFWENRIQWGESWRFAGHEPMTSIVDRDVFGLDPLFAWMTWCWGAIAEDFKKAASR